MAGPACGQDAAPLAAALMGAIAVRGRPRRRTAGIVRAALMAAAVIDAALTCAVAVRGRPGLRTAGIVRAALMAAAVVD